MKQLGVRQDHDIFLILVHSDEEKGTLEGWMNVLCIFFHNSCGKFYNPKASSNIYGWIKRNFLIKNQQNIHISANDFI